MKRDSNTSSCRMLAPEDILPNDYIVQMQVIQEFPSFYYMDEATTQDVEQPLRYASIPCDPGQPARVQAVCLPFVFVKLTTGHYVTWDVRLCRLARVSREFADQVWKRSEHVRACRKARKRRKARKAS